MPKPTAGLLDKLLDEFLDAFAERVAARVALILDAREQQQDRDLGYLSQKTLPPWIHPDTYVEACRGGRIKGARLWRRQWLAPKDAVRIWAESESQVPVPPELDPDSLEALIAANGGKLLKPR